MAGFGLPRNDAIPWSRTKEGMPFYLRLFQNSLTLNHPRIQLSARRHSSAPQVSPSSNAERTTSGVLR